MQNTQFSFDLGDRFEIEQDFVCFKDVIVDRKSKYTVVAGKINKLEDVKLFIKKLNTDSYFRKSTHNTYAYRLKDENGLILEGKNDDGETGAGNCILRELKRKNALNMVIVVTRYFGGIYLNADRFKNVINSCKILFEKL